MLTTQELILRAPAAAATRPAPHCSPLYRMLNTMDVIEALAGEGFVPVDARQGKTSSGEYDPAHAQHMIRFRHKGHVDISDRSRLASLAVPELLIINSSDGRTRFEAALALWRKICSNGMVAMRDIARQSTIHRNITPETMIGLARNMTALAEPLLKKVEVWSGLELTQKEAEDFARAMAAMRWGAAGDAFEAASLLTARRPEDEDRTLWNVFNTLQEVGIRGGVSGSRADANGKQRRVTARELDSIPATMNFNSELWAQADSIAARLIGRAARKEVVAA